MGVTTVEEQNGNRITQFLIKRQKDGGPSPTSFPFHFLREYYFFFKNDFYHNKNILKT